MKNKKQPHDNANPGITAGIVIGFMAGLLLNSIFIPVAIGIGALFDQIKNRQNK